MSRDPYKRRATGRLPRFELPPTSERRMDDETPTMVPCPVCKGSGLVAHETRQQMISAHPELVTQPPPNDEPPKDAA